MKKNYLILILLILAVVVTGCKNNTEASQKTLDIIEDAPYREDLSINNNNNNIVEPEFTGIKGENVNIVNSEIKISSSNFETGVAKYYNTIMPSGKTVYFFVVKDKDGKYRAAANACQVCHNARMGFRQEGNNMICNTCGNAYPMEKIATEKGGCNPGPINPDLAVRDGNIVISQSDIAQVVDLF